MTDLRQLLRTENVPVLRLLIDEIDMAREAIMTDAENALLGAAETIRPDASLTHADRLATLDRLTRTLNKLVAAMTALREELAQRSAAQNKRLC
jgi:hypothetical protein